MLTILLRIFAFGILRTVCFNGTRELVGVEGKTDAMSYEKVLQSCLILQLTRFWVINGYFNRI